jgi:hypothetical protein
MKGRAKETALKSRYSRVERAGRLSPSHAPPEIGNFNRSNLAPDGSTYLCVEEAPLPGWQLLADYGTNTVFARPNEILLFRLLEHFFGPADLLGVAVRTSDLDASPLPGIPLTTDWGFALQIEPALIGEVRSLDRNSRHVIRSWVADAGQARSITSGQRSRSIDFATTSGTHSRTISTCSRRSRSSSGRRPNSRRFSPGRASWGHLLDAAAVLQDTESVLELEGQLVQEGTREALLSSAATLFLVSFEAFVNLLYALLLRPEFSDRHYERLLTRLDLSLRVSSLQVFCRGFSRQPIVPESDLWDEITELREFRNDLVHGNVTDEHQIHLLREGDHFFYFAPFRDYRGPAREKQVSGRIRRYTLNIDDSFVRRVRDVVDRAQKAVVDALNPDLVAWARDLFDEDTVLPPPRA